MRACVAGDVWHWWQVVNRVQKLRKKAGLVSTDAVDVYVGATDADLTSCSDSVLRHVLVVQVTHPLLRFCWYNQCLGWNFW